MGCRGDTDLTPDALKQTVVKAMVQLLVSWLPGGICQATHSAGCASEVALLDIAWSVPEEVPFGRALTEPCCMLQPPTWPKSRCSWVSGRLSVAALV